MRYFKLGIAALTSALLLGGSATAWASTTFSGVSAPTISGTRAVGQTLTAKPDTATTPTASSRTYQWQRYSGRYRSISGATAATYELTPADRGTRIRVQICYIRTGYTTKCVYSARTGAIAYGKFTGVSAPTVFGTRAVGKTLTAKPDSTTVPTASVRTYSWQRYYSGGYHTISGATAATYQPTAADKGRALRVKVGYREPGYSTKYVYSARTGAVAAGTLTAPTPTITGTAAVGLVLTAKPGTWTPGTDLSYRWLRNGASITGATATAYRLVSADAGKRISVKVTGKKSGYTTASRTSTPTATVAATMAAPTIISVSPARGAAAGGTSITVTGTNLTGATRLTVGGATATSVVVKSATVVTGVVPPHAPGVVDVTVTTPGGTATSKAGFTYHLGNTLRAGDTLQTGMSLVSGNGAYTLVMQGDGNLVEYGPSGAVWASGTTGASHAVLQGDGNLVLYTAAGVAKWGSGTDGFGAGLILHLQDDGNLVLYRDGSAVWSRAVVRWLTVGAKAMAGSTPGTQSMSGPTLNSTQYGIYAPGTKVAVVCGTTSGQGVKGAYSATLDPTWHRTLRGDWVPDADFLTGTNGLFAGEPDCSPSSGGVGATKLDNYVAAHPQGSVVGSGQCVDLVKDYLRAVWGLNPGAIGNAEAYRPGRTGGNYFAANGFVWHTDQEFQPGDVLVWSQTVLSGGAVNAFGHVGIWYKGAKPLYQQNAWPNTLAVGFGTFFNGGGNVYSGYWRHA